MEKIEFLEFSNRELKEIENFKKEIKQGKLKMFFISLLEHNNLEIIQKIIDNQEDFYLGIDTLTILNQSIENIKESIFRDSSIKAIENIKNITDEKYMYIKDLLLDSLIKKVNYIEECFLIEDGLTSTKIEGSPYAKEILKITQSFLLKNPQYVSKFEHINLKEFTVLSNMIYLDNKLPAKNVVEKKLKI